MSTLIRYYEKEVANADNVIICCSTETNRTNINGTQVTDKEELTNSDKKNSDTMMFTIEDTLGVLEVTSFKYSKRDTHKTSASAAHLYITLLRQQQPMSTQTTS